MSTEPKKEPENQERAERQRTFSRRGLLQWSVPVVLAVSLPAQLSAAPSGHTDGHGDHHHDQHKDED
jgi:hypothetical protein